MGVAFGCVAEDESEMHRLPDAGFSRTRLAVVGLALLGLFAGAGWIRADSAMPLEPRDYSSSNGRFVFRVIPRMPVTPEGPEPTTPGTGPEESPPRGILSERSGMGTNELWSIQLVNKDAPSDAVVADDGRHVVTLDNWYGAGYGPDVLVFYSSGGFLRSYSLEQALSDIVPDKGAWYRALPKPVRSAVDFAELTPAPVQYWKLFSHSVSSRGWQDDGFHFIEVLDGHPLFCQWLGWAQKWLVFRMTDGAKLTVSGKLRERLDRAGREWALRQCRDGDRSREAAAFLYRLNLPEDRARIGEGLTRFGGVNLASFLHPIDAARLKQFAEIPGITAVGAAVPAGAALTQGELLAGLAAFPALEQVYLGSVTIPDPTAAILGGLRTLRRIDLNGTRLSDAGLAAVCRNVQLEDLWLSENPITDAGMAALEPLRSLKMLNLCETQVTDAGVVHLRGLTNLTYLHLCGPGITDRAIEELLGMKNLDELWLADTRVTDAGLVLAGLPRLGQLLLTRRRSPTPA